MEWVQDYASKKAEEISGALAMWDVNRDGKITLQEHVASCMKSGFSEYHSLTLFYNLLAFYDTNGDGMVSPADARIIFHDAVVEKLNPIEKKIQFYFQNYTELSLKYFDKDHDGFVDVGELCQVFVSYGLTVEESTRIAYFFIKKFDKNGDERLSIEDFK